MGAVLKLRVLDLFSGIGGFSLGLERAGGFETVAFCEIEPFPRKVLAKHWPEVPCYEDVTKLTGDILARDGIAVDVITGGFPCQDISVAGKQAGISDGTRSGLWSEIVRLIGELSPRYVIVENVANLLSGPGDKRGGWFGRILADLAECGYDAEWENIPAAAVGAPHRRERVWIVAYPNEKRRKGRTQKQVFQLAGKSRELVRKHVNGKVERGNKQKRFVGSLGEVLADTAQLQRDGSGEHRQPGERQVSQSGKRGCADNVADANNQRLQGRQEAGNPQGIRPWGIQLTQRCANLSRAAWEPEPAVGRVANGVPSRVDRLKGLGNAVVPQIPELIGRAIMEAEGKT